MVAMRRLDPAWPDKRSGGITVEEFMEMPAFYGRFELIDGGIFKKPVSNFEHGTIAFLILKAYIQFDPTEELGVMRQEVNFFLQADYSPAPDVLYWRADRAPKRKVKIAPRPDLAIEVQSPDQSIKELTRKAWAYIAGGVPVVWVIQPGKQIAAIFRQGQTEPETIQPGGILDAGEVIPGFKVPMSLLFEAEAEAESE